MKSSCITNPTREKLITIREWQVEFCNRNTCAAALLSFFIFWYDIKKEGFNDITPTAFSLSELEEGILYLYKKEAIRKAIILLKELKAITTHKNPNPKFSFDKTTFYLLHPKTLNKYLGERS